MLKNALQNMVNQNKNIHSYLVSSYLRSETVKSLPDDSLVSFHDFQKFLNQYFLVFEVKNDAQNNHELFANFITTAPQFNFENQDAVIKYFSQHSTLCMQPKNIIQKPLSPTEYYL